MSLVSVEQLDRYIEKQREVLRGRELRIRDLEAEVGALRSEVNKVRSIIEMAWRVIEQNEPVTPVTSMWDLREALYEYEPTCCQECKGGVK